MVYNKYSYGIICFRTNETSHKLEVLLIQKHNTYAFMDFVYGKYNTLQDVRELLNKMTIDEKMVLMSGNFVLIWYMVWTNVHKNKHFYVAKAKFENMFGNNKKLSGLINGTRNGYKIYEPPKGQTMAEENSLNCAIREFGEETCIQKHNYKIIDFNEHWYVFTDGGIQYNNGYYIAYMDQCTEPIIKITNEIREVSDIVWMCLDQIQIVDKQLYQFLKPIFKEVKTFLFKGGL
ncbi:MAG: NUDIX domain-containing protein [Acidimicrobiales bacterium]